MALIWYCYVRSTANTPIVSSRWYDDTIPGATRGISGATRCVRETRLCSQKYCSPCWSVLSTVLLQYVACFGVCLVGLSQGSSVFLPSAIREWFQPRNKMEDKMWELCQKHQLNCPFQPPGHGDVALVIHSRTEPLQRVRACWRQTDRPTHKQTD